MKINTILKFHARITGTMKFLKTPRKNNENNENHRIPLTGIIKIMKILEKFKSES